MAEPWLFVLFNVIPEKHAGLPKRDVLLLYHRAVEETAGVVAGSGRRVGLLLRADGRVEAEYAALELAELCTVADRVPPRCLLLEVPGMALDGAVRAVAELPGTRMAGAAVLAQLARDLCAEWGQESELPLSALLKNAPLRDALWGDAVRVCRHDVSGAFRRLRELLRSEDGQALRGYLGAHGDTLLAAVRLANGKLSARAHRYFPCDESVLAGKNGALLALESALTRMTISPCPRGGEDLRAALTAADASLAEPSPHGSRGGRA